MERIAVAVALAEHGRRHTAVTVRLHDEARDGAADSAWAASRQIGWAEMTLMTIDSIAAGGEGVGRLPDGRVAFVSRTSPGDVVEVVEVDKKPRYVRAQVISLKTPGPDRVDPACVHYTRDGCGGCQLQHLAPQAQRHAKRRVVGDALRLIAGLSIDDPEIVASDDAWRYRSKITLTARTTQQGRREFGLHRYATPGVFEPIDCLITRERVMALWGRLRDHGAFFPPITESVTLREDRDGGTTWCSPPARHRGTRVCWRKRLATARCRIGGGHPGGRRASSPAREPDSRRSLSNSRIRCWPTHSTRRGLGSGRY